MKKPNFNKTKNKMFINKYEYTDKKVKVNAYFKQPFDHQS